ncbi:MAG: methyltransferase domain-containing protein [Myxococcales bacterium]|nr:MAG: methyltransferase domain-containing protein [Myxococcales bacterium]
MKQVILKVDDFRLNDGLTKFEKLVAICERHSVPISMGVIGAGLKGGRFRSQQLFAQLIQADKLELWNHSFNHRDMTELDDATVAWEVAATTTACEQALAARPIGFGAPFNRCDDRVARIAHEQGMGFTFEVSLPRAVVLTPEYNVPFDGQPNLIEFQRRVERKQRPDLLVVQIHPGRWLTRGFDEIDACLTWLRDQGYSATTVGSLLNLQSGATKAVTAHDMLVAKLHDRWLSSASVLDSKLRNFSSYFLSRFRANSRPIRELLPSIDADLGARNVVDVGCGLGQWGLPFFEFNKDATVWAFDTNTVLCSTLAEARAERLIPYDLRVEQADFTTSTKLPAKGVDVVVCANALNYIPLAAFARQAQHIARDGAKLVFVNQTSAFNHQGVLDALGSSNLSMAKERALAELRQQVVRYGFAGFTPNRTTLTDAELEAVLFAFGFQLSDDFTPPWERSLAGSPTFSGTVFTRRAWLTLASLPDSARPEYRKLLCRAGHSALDDELFAASGMDSDDLTLWRLKARSGSPAPMLVPELEREHELGRLSDARDFAAVARFVMSSDSDSPEWLLAGAVAALAGEDGATARQLASRIAPAELAPKTHRLLQAACYLAESDARAASALLQS